MKTPEELRRANLLILAAMVIFALLLATACFLWMRAKVKAQTAAFTETPVMAASHPLHSLISAIL